MQIDEMRAAAKPANIKRQKVDDVLTKKKVSYSYFHTYVAFESHGVLVKYL